MVIKRNSLLARIFWILPFVRIEDVRVGQDVETYIRVSWK